MTARGIIACGHPETARAAETILRAGGNAFDAIVAAHFAACIAEPVLASLGGGGFLLAHTADGQDVIYDFFARTPLTKRAADDCDFYPIHADFGTTTQEFHIGMGAVSVPGSVKGMFDIHRDLCSLSMRELVAPAVELARKGVTVNQLQSYIFDIIKPILLATAESRTLYTKQADNNVLVTKGDILRFHEQANLLEALAREGDALFYRGEIAREIACLSMDHGGHLTLDDLSQYEVIKRVPLQINYRQALINTNPPPSSGGILIAFALRLLECIDLSHHERNSPELLSLLAEAMALTNKARLDTHIDETNNSSMLHILDQAYLKQYQTEIYRRSQSLRGTTHISIIDRQGNMASMTVSNGEGCGHIIPDTGVMLNNMLGEEDLNPGGFHRWPPGHRMTSMMAPSSVVFADGSRIALGSGGSNRLRTAILQVLVNVIDFGMDLDEAVRCPRIHNENNLLSIEGGFPEPAAGALLLQHSNNKQWDTLNLFFGGTHCVMQRSGDQGVEFSGKGDPRRGGVSILVE